MGVRDSIRWGIIGCGNVTEVKSGPAFRLARGSRLVSVMRRNGALAEDYARRHGVAKWTDRAEQVIHDPEVDAVYVATPPGSHMDYALQVCAAGKPCYVEKPMARNAAECRRMVDAFAAAGLPLFVAYYRRGLPRFLAAKELIEGGRIGAVRSLDYVYRSRARTDLDPARLPWRLVAEHSGGGLFLDLASHALDIFDFMLGPIRDVSSEVRRRGAAYDVEDYVSMHFRIGQGAEGRALWDFGADAGEDRFVISGDTGRIEMSVFGNEPLRLAGASGLTELGRPNPPHIQQPLVQTMVDELLGSGRCPSRGDTAIRASAVMDAALAPYYGARHDAFWTRSATWPGLRA